MFQGFHWNKLIGIITVLIGFIVIFKVVPFWAFLGILGTILIIVGYTIFKIE